MYITPTTTTAAIPCPPAHYGGPRECAHCPREIPVGAAALRNEFGAYVHPECLDTVTGAFGLQRPAGTTGAPASTPTHHSAPRPSAGADIGDLVVAELQRRRKGQSSDELVAADQLIGEIQFRRSAGLPPPQRPATKAGQGDLGDQVVAILQQRRGQAGAT